MNRLPLLAAGVLMAGCQSIAAPVPAVLTTADAPTMERVKAALAKAMGRARIELGAADPLHSPDLPVLPPPPGPLEDRSLAKPTLFRLELADGVCWVARVDGGARERVDGVACRAAG